MPYRSKSVVCLLALLLSASQLRGGGPLYIGGSAFDPAARGKGIGWANGQLTYFTDQGDLSPLLDQAAANSFVDEALQTWASVPTAALTITRGGALGEDVNGGNVTSSGMLPADIQPSATGKPLAVVYDSDGQVTEALLGVGASDPALCSANSVMGGVDNLITAGNLVHALVIINGRCALSSTDLVALKYRLIRKFGEVLGLGWSQANDNVRSGLPAPTADDFAGFPIMHPEALLCLLPGGSTCAGASVLRMDDRAAVSRLYPVTVDNASQFPGKQVFADQTIRVSGSVYFANTNGSRGQPMQGVNVVARLIDPATGVPSRKSVATSVSGFLFRGNAGNEVSGFIAPSGQRFDAFGSADATLEGFYDLAGLELPAGSATANYQISLEAVSPLYSGDKTVGPYGIGPVMPSGDLAAATATLVGIVAGADEVQDFLSAKSAKIGSDGAEPNPFSSPSPVPSSGEWFGSLASYGDSDFFIFTARGNRSMDFEVTALNEAFSPTAGKAQPTLGIWLGTDPAGSPPRLLQNSFNSAGTGLTRLGANIFQDSQLKLGIADVRGDGRPDYLYHARLLYADRITPLRVNAASTPVVIDGIGFRSGMTATIGGVSAPVLFTADNQIIASSPALADGPQDLTLLEPATGMTVTMTAALQYGADSGSQIVLLSGSTPATPLGADAAIPVRVRVLASDGVTPLPAVAVTFSVPTTSLLSPCGASSCSVMSDDAGEAASTLTVKFAGINVVTASLSNGARVQTTILGSSTGLVLAAVNPSRFIASGSTVSLTLGVRALNGDGSTAAGQQVSFLRTVGSGTLTSSSATTDANGSASTILNIAAVNGSTTVVACLSAGACPQFTIQAIAPANLQLHILGGDGQVVRTGQSPQPILMRVTDSASPSNYAAGVPVAVSELVMASLGPSTCTPSEGVCSPATPKIISNSLTTLISDANGLITFIPAVQTSWGAVQISLHAVVNATATLDAGLRVIP